MANFEKMYYTMFNAATDAVEKLEQEDISGAMLVLATAQCTCEELYMQDEEKDE